MRLRSSAKQLRREKRLAMLIVSRLAFALVLASGSCVTYREELNLSQRHFEANEYERALSLLRDLERNLQALEGPDRARYSYLRGMSDYRMAYRADARHWLALAREVERAKPGALSEAWTARLAEALKDLDQEVFTLVRNADLALPDAGPTSTADEKH